MRKAVISITLLIVVAVIGVIVWWQFSKPTETVIINKHEVIGTSVEGRSLDVYSYGTSTRNILFVGGIHGGYEPKTVDLALAVIDYLNSNLNLIPTNLTVNVIPNLNPDGLLKGIRFNARNVDLNRNFACNWQPESMWKGNKVSAGTSVFSEPEAVALRDYIFKTKPEAVIFWHSQGNAVYASQCNSGILPATQILLNTYSIASGYQAIQTFDSYAVTGAAEDWLASIGIPALTVEFSSHANMDWDKNIAGVKAVLNYYKNL